MDEFFNSKEFKEKLSKYEEAKQQGLSVFLDSDDMADIAEYYHLQHRDKEAVEICDEALAMFPHSLRPLVFKARIELILHKDPDKAESYLEQIDDTDDLDYYYLYAEILLARGKGKEAEEYLEDVYDRLEDEDDRADFVLDVALMMCDYYMMDEAQRWLNLSDEPDQADYQEAKGRIALYKGRYEESEKIFNQLLDKDPYSSPYWNTLATSQFLRNDIHDSIESSEYSIAINPNDDEALLNKANGLFTLGNYQEALNYYERYTKVGNHALGTAFQAVAYMALKQYPKARRMLEESIAEMPKDDENLYEVIRQLCLCLSAMKEIQEAQQWADRMFSLKNIERWQVYIFKGYLYLLGSSISDAQRCFNKAVICGPSLTSVVISICMALHDCEQYGYAYSMHNYILQTTKEDVRIGFAYLADDCLHLNDIDAYKKYLRIACRFNPDEVAYVFAEQIPENVRPEDYWKIVCNE
ncbi:MAG: tetratricopeptide repeat protein [Prevotella sp.]|jgi:tetratricopeptide (TPR) repeat protein